MSNRYRVATFRATGWGSSHYLGGDSVKAWDTYRKVSALGALRGEHVALSRWNSEALSGMGRWDTVTQFMPGLTVVDSRVMPDLAEPCPDCKAEAGETCHPDCSTFWTEEE